MSEVFKVHRVDFSSFILSDDGDECATRFPYVVSYLFNQPTVDEVIYMPIKYSTCVGTVGRIHSGNVTPMWTGATVTRDLWKSLKFEWEQFRSLGKVTSTDLMLNDLGEKVSFNSKLAYQYVTPNEVQDFLDNNKTKFTILSKPDFEIHIAKGKDEVLYRVVNKECDIFELPPVLLIAASGSNEFNKDLHSELFDGIDPIIHSVVIKTDKKFHLSIELFDEDGYVIYKDTKDHPTGANKYTTPTCLFDYIKTLNIK